MKYWEILILAGLLKIIICLAKDFTENNIMFFICLFLLTINLTSCSTNSSGPSDEIVREYSKSLWKDGIFLDGLGGSVLEDRKFTDKHTLIVASYVSNKKVDVVEARRMIIRLTKGLARAINASEKLRPHLHVYPFPEDRLEVDIMFLDKNGDRYPPPFVSGVFIAVNKKPPRVFFSFRNNEKRIIRELDKVESYEEACRIVESEGR